MKNVFSRRNPARLAALSALVAATAVLAWFLTSSDDGADVLVSSRIGEAATVEKLSSPVDQSQRAGVVTAPASQANSVPIVAVEPMHRRYSTSGNLAAFMQDALTRPEEGGRFYASLAYAHCRRIDGISVPSDVSDVGEPRRVAREKLEREIARCRGVLDQFGRDGIQIARQALDDRLGPDKLMPAAGRGIFVAASEEAAKSDLAAAIATKDTHVIAVVMEANADYLIPTIASRVGSAVPSQIVYAAVASVSCELVSRCVDSIGVLSRCAIEGQCDANDEREVIRERISPDMRPMYDEVRRVLDSITRTGLKT
jgi:hypothetical protein